jgi:hypothetical protein
MSLSPESIKVCAAGPFAAEDLTPFLPALAREIAAHGETAVVQRCQIARANCATPGFAVECVKFYFDCPEASRAIREMASRAMTKEEREAACVAWTEMFAPLRQMRPMAIKVTVDDKSV